MIITDMEVALGAPDRGNIPCLMHATRLCQLDVKITNNYHGTKNIQIQNLSRCKKRYSQHIRQVVNVLRTWYFRRYLCDVHFTFQLNVWRTSPSTTSHLDINILSISEYLLATARWFLTSWGTYIFIIHAYNYIYSIVALDQNVF